ncbi:protein tas isoform X5 [Manihot esculenta]|uniref:protein tas isoform X5 n=1 Tax=Manihot esculenta TaxID=3983 RepID=UPI000B5D914A|nr:protein tas isoform X5 [Manihot esculenta]
MSVPLFNLTPNLTVSRLCLGTMTFGEQNSLPQSFRLLDEAFHAGINFFDSAEMYPVPQRAETRGRSEEYLGRWIRERKIPRNRVVIATKVTGPSGQMVWIRGGPKCLDAKNITEAIDNSLQRMQMDYIDLYQIHWPDRFNSYSLLCRTFDSGLAECCHHEGISLLAYSPLAMGILSGKYFAPNGGPANGRLNLFKGRYSEGESRYNLSNNMIKAATMEYLDIAKKHGLHPVSLAIAFVLRHPLVASTIFGATSSWQLQETLNGCKIQLTPEIIEDINKDAHAPVDAVLDDEHKQLPACCCIFLNYCCVECCIYLGSNLIQI